MAYVWALFVPLFAAVVVAAGDDGDAGSTSADITKSLFLGAYG